MDYVAFPNYNIEGDETHFEVSVPMNEKEFAIQYLKEDAGDGLLYTDKNNYIVDDPLGLVIPPHLKNIKQRFFFKGNAIKSSQRDMKILQWKA